MDKNTTVEERLIMLSLIDDARKVCAQYGVTVAEAMSRERTKSVAAARHAVWWILHFKGKFSGKQIARLCDVNPATVNGVLQRVRDGEGLPSPAPQKRNPR